VTDPAPAASRPAFAHASEAELARILDFYAVRWSYEPDTFPIAWNLDGDVIESFSPDFYLPDVELYVELTTLKQKLVRKKNRKLRRLRELYTDIRIKLFYARDFRMLLLKFGRLALHDELSGTTGQSTPPRLIVDEPEPEAAPAAAPAPASDDSEPPGGDPLVTDPVLAPTAREGRGRRRGKRRRRPGTTVGVGAALEIAGAPGAHPA
jgi:hypoxanthine phosphoribosyltransferase